MAITNSLIDSAGPTPIFTANTGTDFAVTCILFCNTDLANDALIDVWAVPNGQVPTIANQIMAKVPIPPTETFVMDTEKLILSSQDAIYAQSNIPASFKVCGTVSVVEI